MQSQVDHRRNWFLKLLDDRNGDGDEEVAESNFLIVKDESDRGRNQDVN